MISTRSLVMLGFVLMVVGAIQIALHYQAGGSVSITTCLGGSLTLPVDTPLLHRVHCWGCYASALGAMLSASAFGSKVWSLHFAQR